MSERQARTMLRLGLALMLGILLAFGLSQALACESSPEEEPQKEPEGNPAEPKKGPTQDPEAAQGVAEGRAIVAGADSTIVVAPGERVTIEGAPLPPLPDSDGDGFPDPVNNEDRCQGFDDAKDLDGDNLPDGCDPDRDGDGRPNNTDFAPDDKDVQDEPPRCVGTQVKPGDNLQGIVNGNSATQATNFCLAAGDYPITSTLQLRAGDKLIGPEGTVVIRGPAAYGVPKAHVHADNTTLSRLIQYNAGGPAVEWVELSGADTTYNQTAQGSCTTRYVAGRGCLNNGTGTAISMNNGGPGSRLAYSFVHNNDMAGLGAAGFVVNNHFTDNSRDPASLGFGGSSLKGIVEFVFARNFVEGEQGNGPWFDHSLKGAGNVPEMASNPGGGAWFHHNLLVDNGRWGMRFEYVPRDVAAGEHPSAPSFLAEDNVVAGNGTEPGHTAGGASQEDAMNGTWRNNEFGPVTIGGVSYGHNESSLALRLSDGQARTTDLFNTSVTGNTLRDGETIGGCQFSDDRVACSDNGP